MKVSQAAVWTCWILCVRVMSCAKTSVHNKKNTLLHKAGGVPLCREWPVNSRAQLVERFKVPLRGAEVGFASLNGKSTDAHRGSTPA